jgi:hypothetical protein
MAPTGYPETPARKYHSMLRKIPKERRAEKKCFLSSENTTRLSLTSVIQKWALLDFTPSQSLQ